MPYVKKMIEVNEFKNKSNSRRNIKKMLLKKGFTEEQINAYFEHKDKLNKYVHMRRAKEN